MWGTPDSVKSTTSKYVTIVPGDQKSLDLSKLIISKLALKINPDLVQKLIPAGKGRIASK